MSRWNLAIFRLSKNRANSRIDGISEGKLRPIPRTARFLLRNFHLFREQRAFSCKLPHFALLARFLRSTSVYPYFGLVFAKSSAFSSLAPAPAKASSSSLTPSPNLIRKSRIGLIQQKQLHPVFCLSSVWTEPRLLLCPSDMQGSITVYCWNAKGDNGAGRTNWY